MFRTLPSLLLLILAQSGVAASPDPAVQVMVLGTFHLDNPGLDEHNVRVDSPLSPKKQKELEQVATRLARFRPTRIIVEGQPPTADLSMTSYRVFTPDMLTQTGKENEVFQIGYRLAKRLGHANVYGIDERQGPGEPSYWQYDRVKAYAEAHGMMDRLSAPSRAIEARNAQFEKLQKSRTIAEMLAWVNSPASFREDHSAYYSDLAIGDFSDQPGAEHNAYWYMRNAKSFAKLVHMVKPGERVLVIFGAGHGFWLRHFVENMPGFELIEPAPYLRGTKGSQ